VSDRLKVDLGQLTEAARQLDLLGAELQRAGNGLDDARAAVGSGHLADKLQHFVDGWRVHREDLLEDIQHLAGTTHKAVDTYRQADDQLAQAVRGDGR
jgi:uncharacterized protein YukE